MIWVIAATVVAHQILLYLQRRRFDAFDGLVLLDAVVLLICVYGALLDPEVRRFVEHDTEFTLMLYGGVVALYLGLHLPVVWGAGQVASGIPKNEIEKGSPRLGVLYGLTTIYVLVSMLQLRQWAAAAGGVVAWLTGPRNALYGEALEGGGEPYCR